MECKDSKLLQAALDFQNSKAEPEINDIKDIFIAGAEWMEGQFRKIKGKLVDRYSTLDGKDYCYGVKSNEYFEVPEGFYIRKKQ